MRNQQMNRMRSSHQSKFLRILTTPYRALCRARDMYVRSVTRCGQPASYAPSKSKSKSKPNLPRSFSAASSSSVSSSVDNEDYRELVRAASVRTLTDNGVEAEIMMPRRQPRSVARSASVGIGMGRIDEEAPFEVGVGDDQIGLEMVGGIRKVKKRGDLLYPRSRSYAVGNKNIGF